MNTETLGSVYPPNYYIAQPVEMDFLQRLWYCLSGRYDDRIC